MITAAYVMSGGSLLMILDLPAMMIVIGGTLGASVVGSSLDDCYELGTLLRINFLSSEIRFHEVVSTLVHCARTARKSGLLSIQASVNPTVLAEKLESYLPLKMRVLSTRQASEGG